MLAELVEAVRARRVHPTELVEEALRRIDVLDGDIGSTVALRAEAALADARVSSRGGTLAGVPFLVKDLARCAGLPTTYGSPLHTGRPAETVDDTTVARLRGAGAIPIGKTNTPAYGWTAVTTNPVFGTTRNPWNPSRSPGGSSGGSAAALSAGLVPLATSSDGGGSVRIPASSCGLVGYKPTIGAVGRDGAPRWIDFSGWGATGATVADVVLEASVYFGATAGDLRALPAGAIDVTPRQPRRVLMCRSLRAAVAPAIEAALREAADDLAARGLVVEEIDNPAPGAVITWAIQAMAEMAESLVPERERWGELEPELVRMLEFGASVTTGDYIAARRRGYELCAVYDRLLGDDAVLITPTVNAESWPAEGPLATSVGGIEQPGIAVNTIEFNVTGHPAVSVPLGRDAAGVPFGMQVVAPRWRDGLALGLAAVIERERPWPPVADGYAPFPIP